MMLGLVSQLEGTSVSEEIPFLIWHLMRCYYTCIYKLLTL